MRELIKKQEQMMIDDIESGDSVRFLGGNIQCNVKGLSINPEQVFFLCSSIVHF